MNIVVISGSLALDKVREIGGQGVRFFVGVPGPRRETGERIYESVPVLAFGTTADLLRAMVRERADAGMKRATVYIAGRIQARFNEVHGQKKHDIVVIADRIEMALGATGTPTEEARPNAFEGSLDDDIPF